MAQLFQWLLINCFAWRSLKYNKLIQPPETRDHESSVADAVDAPLPQADDVVGVDVDAAEPEPGHLETPSRHSSGANVERRPALLLLEQRPLQPVVGQTDDRLLASALRRLGSGRHSQRSKDPIHFARRCHRRWSLSSQGWANLSFSLSRSRS